MSDSTMREALKKAQGSLIAIGVGSCNCNTKSPNVAFHLGYCRYLKVMSALEDIDAALSISGTEGDERDTIVRVIVDGFTNGNVQYDDLEPHRKRDFDMAADAVLESSRIFRETLASSAPTDRGEPRKPRAWIANDPEGGPYLTWSETAAKSYPNPIALYEGEPAPAAVAVEREALANKLEETTQLMASHCTVSQHLWDKHSNAALAAVAILRTPVQEREDAEKLKQLQDNPNGKRESHPTPDPALKHAHRDAPMQSARMDDREVLIAGLAETFPGTFTLPAETPNAFAADVADFVLSVLRNRAVQGPRIDAEKIAQAIDEVLLAVDDNAVAGKDSGGNIVLRGSFLTVIERLRQTRQGGEFGISN